MKHLERALGPAEWKFYCIHNFCNIFVVLNLNKIFMYIKKNNTVFLDKFWAVSITLLFTFSIEQVKYPPLLVVTLNLLLVIYVRLSVENQIIGNKKFIKLCKKG